MASFLRDFNILIISTHVNHILIAIIFVLAVAIAKMLLHFVTKMPIVGSLRKIMAMNVDVRMVTMKMDIKMETLEIQFVSIIACARMALHTVRTKEHV